MFQGRADSNNNNNNNNNNKSEEQEEERLGRDHRFEIIARTRSRTARNTRVVMPKGKNNGRHFEMLYLLSTCGEK